MPLVCHFEFNGEVITTQDQPYKPCATGLDAFNKGFWIDENLQLTVSADKSKFWIPPTAIKHIERVTPEPQFTEAELAPSEVAEVESE